ncbi:DUF2848 domain-containing protein [Sneathiella chinensis]|uniref:DUF2848 domain-containing protein n=1 Tax=Sneathiella chinensis TaxID=349750 RepID=A0ABQ5U004_9PROT|nr:DUF2848 domain-containing protein [Sneathiella chinensis]GLQ05053.1 hypothetical protein GCM10007924_02740 [Sneathiella chinensis]
MQFKTPEGALECAPVKLVVAGWTGRDRAAVDHHIEELAAIGVPAPSSVPLYYQCSAALLTQEPQIQALAEGSSGEAEPFILKSDGKVWLGLASDHTDRSLETYSVAHSKQICAKPVADTLWLFDDVKDRLDQLELRSWIRENGDWVAYQDGMLASILPLADLMAGADLPDNAAMLCGTLPAIGGVRPATDFRMQLHDPATGNTIEWSYTTECLAVVA